MNLLNVEPPEPYRFALVRISANGQEQTSNDSLLISIFLTVAIVMPLWLFSSLMVVIFFLFVFCSHYCGFNINCLNVFLIRVASCNSWLVLLSRKEAKNTKSLHSTSNIRHSTFNIRHPISDIQHPTFSPNSFLSRQVLPGEFPADSPEFAE